MDDVVEANLRALEGAADGEVLNIGWGLEIRDIEVLLAVRRALGVALEPVFTPKRAGEMNRVALNAERAKAILHWEPRIAFEEGVPLAVAAYRTR